MSYIVINLVLVIIVRFPEIYSQNFGQFSYAMLMKNAQKDLRGDFEIRYPTKTNRSKVQSPFPKVMPFPCWNSTKSGIGRSLTKPTSVHRLRPGDIDVVGAMGDQRPQIETGRHRRRRRYGRLVSGGKRRHGRLGSRHHDREQGDIVVYRRAGNLEGIQFNPRLTGYSTGTILKEFNPRLTGYSTGTGEFLSPSARLNVAFPVSADADALRQAKILVKKIREDPDINFGDDWKMVTIFFGANDLCSAQCYDKEKASPLSHANKLKAALDYLQEYLPRTFVNLIPVTPRCRFRDHEILYPPDEIWRYVSGYECYGYTNTIRLNFILRKQLVNYRGYNVPYVVLAGNRVVFDYQDKSYLKLIQILFKTERFFNLWKECSELADECCHKHMDEINVYPNKTHVCPALWDGWDCWPATQATETARRICPKHSYTGESIACVLESEKYCLATSWNQTTNYEVCSTVPSLTERNQFHVTILIISSALTFPAILIFLVFMRNHKDLRHALYRNLLIAIVLKNILTITSKKVIILDFLLPSNESNFVMEENSVGCRILTFFNNLVTVSIFTCMFLIAYYLHSIIARIFGKQLSLNSYHILSIFLSLIPIIPWAILMGTNQIENCWLVDKHGFHWINDAYKYGVLVGNLILLLDIMRVICLQRSNNSLNRNQTKASIKAIAVLIPLFGLPLLITSQTSLIAEKSCLAGNIYFIFAYSVEALQGIIIALLFCYLSKEIHQEFRKSYRKCVIGINERFGTNFKVPWDEF
ncbi:GDSL-like Lipase/Acylhydrolase [Popillia japonica]|uniref:GDSL-like Lipase/Acylhydrolase n=1 Tax=Popillia japonica TaxID=7064 RepID=A0AAW1KLI6_POPJA